MLPNGLRPSTLLVVFAIVGVIPSFSSVEKVVSGSVSLPLPSSLSVVSLVLSSNNVVWGPASSNRPEMRIWVTKG